MHFNSSRPSIPADQKELVSRQHAKLAQDSIQMRATKFEFEQRFWIIGLIFFIGFGLSAVDHTYVAVGLLHLLAPGLDPDSVRGTFSLRLIFAGGALLLFLAAALRTWATAYLRAEIVHDASQHSEALLADGPYRYVRNPLYLANLPMAAGIGVMASRLGWLFIVLAVWVFVYRLILREEDGLLQSQGDSYRAYLKAVPRFWPALTPRLPSGHGVPHWGQAIAAEMIFWLFGVAVLCFAITLNIKLTGIVFASSFAVYFIVVPTLTKRAAAAKSAQPK
jgi:protein-S-isoprenylcysteine O-methyltransferase Ste14